MPSASGAPKPVAHTRHLQRRRIDRRPLGALALMLEANVFSVPQSRVFRLRLLLSNGSSPTYLQLPYVALWYGALL